MHIFHELEQLALDAADAPAEEKQAHSVDTAIRWERLFRYSHADAVEMTKLHRGAIFR